MQNTIKALERSVTEAKKTCVKQRTRVKDTKQYLNGMRTDLADVIRYIQEPATLKVCSSIFIKSLITAEIDSENEEKVSQHV